MPPPGLRPAPAPGYVSTGDSKNDDQLVADGFRACDELGIRPPSHHRMYKLVRRWRAEAATSHTFGDYVISYADPTGETAARNVDNGRRRAA